MDVNGTRLHLLLGNNDWANCSGMPDGSSLLGKVWNASTLDESAADVAWDAVRSEITLKPSILQVTSVPTHTPPSLDKRRGADRDAYGNWYWIDTTGKELLVNSVGTGNTTHFWSLGDGITHATQGEQGNFGLKPEDVQPLPEQLALSGLVVTEDHYLVVGVLQPAGLLIFDLYRGGSPQQLLWPSVVPFVPFDMAPMPGGGVWILDRVHARYWALDRHFNPIPREQQEMLLTPAIVDTFQPIDGGTERSIAARSFLTGITLDISSPLIGTDAIAIESLPDGTVLILDSNNDEAFSLIYRYRFSEMLGQPVSTEAAKMLASEENKDHFQLRAYDFAFVPEHDDPDVLCGKIPDRLYIVPVEGNQVYAFTLAQYENQLELQALALYYPMRMFGGKGLVATSDQVYYDFSTIWIPLIEQRRPRYAVDATLYTPLGEPRHAFDGRVPDCVWHRLLLDACIPAETHVQIWSRAANDENDLLMATWQQEPNLYLRSDGSELPFGEKVSGEGNGTWELLFQAASGRYLQLQIRLTGNGRLTPRLHALRIYYPRFSYLEHYLPAIYGEDSLSASFLDRFLANIEGFYTALEDKIAAVQVLFDARSTPSDALQWLASWFGIALDLTWDTNRQRLFILHAADFFRYRGTLRGLQMILRLTFDDAPDETIFADGSHHSVDISEQSSGIRIVEKFRTRNSLLSATTASGSQMQVVSGTGWPVAQGDADLLQRYRVFLQQQGVENAETMNFPLLAPTCPDVQPLWKHFTQDTLGFIPSVAESDQQPWQDFLIRRYENIELLNRAYQRNFATFADVPLPDTLPSDGPALQDWYAFQAIVLAGRRTAHQFTVLLPVPKQGAAQTSQDDYQHRLELAQRIIELEKPAHTVFEVKFYLSVFRIGEARIGIDTLVDLGGRTPQLMAPMILGQGYLLESYLTTEQLQDMTTRQVLKHERQ